jgi:hypothetical protein
MSPQTPVFSHGGLPLLLAILTWLDPAAKDMYQSAGLKSRHTISCNIID